MLLFKPEHMRPIKLRRKVETRRIWKRKRVKVGALHKCKTKMLSKEYFAVIKILECEKTKLGDMTEENAYNEGYDSLELFKEAFCRINKCDWNPNLEIYYVLFTLAHPVTCVGCNHFDGFCCVKDKWGPNDVKPDDMEAFIVQIRSCDLFDYRFTDLEIARKRIGDIWK